LTAKPPEAPKPSPRRVLPVLGEPLPAIRYPVARVFGVFMEGLSQPTIIVVGVLMTILISVIDLWLTQQQISFLVFYIVPIFIFSWFIGWLPGLTCALVCSLLNFIVDIRYTPSSLNPAEPFINGLTGLLVYVVTARTISLIRNLVEHEREIARTDDVTGAANRRAFYEAVELELHRARRYNQPMTLVVLDLDNFKLVNDRHGHSTGDRALRSVAQIIHRSIRVTDVVARLGGDEFAILLPDTNTEAGSVVVGRIQNSLRLAMDAHQWPITFSIGVATFQNLPTSPDELLQQADGLMYSVKHTSKDAIHQQTI
jgi:diguanylate cyclase (GGDEF)-like protein